MFSITPRPETYWPPHHDSTPICRVCHIRRVGGGLAGVATSHGIFSICRQLGRPTLRLMAWHLSGRANPNHQSHVIKRAGRQRLICISTNNGQGSIVNQKFLRVKVMRKSTPLGEALKLGMTDRFRELGHGQPGYDAVNSMITDGILVPFPPSTRPYHRMACCCLACVPGEPKLGTAARP